MNTNWLLAISLAIAPLASAETHRLTASDQEFVTKAAQGGMAEVVLGEIALERGRSQDVKTFAKAMVRDHGKANADLKRAAMKAGAKLPAEPSSAQKGVAAKLGSLSGAAFDEAYAKTMVEDHEKTIALFETEAANGDNSQLKAFAAETLPTLRQHLEHSKQLNKR
jgi:putative membrane protein